MTRSRRRFIRLDAVTYRGKHTMKTRFNRSGMVGALLGVLVSTPPAAASLDLDALKSLSLDQLADTRVSILSKRPERLADSAAAVFVLTADDIRRSGYTRIPELLRLVPGLTVARADTPEWAVSARGFNGRYSNKLLVMMDGRSVYTPLFSGVFWESLDTMIEDIERIEVIRGPGASTWGANAVNGVINIITRHGADTQGGLASAHAGNQQRGLAMRHGGQLGEDAYLRLYAKGDEEDPQQQLAGNENDDDLATRRIGFRADWQASQADSLMLQGEWYRADAHDPLIHGGNLMLNWERTGDNGVGDTLQIYYDHQRFESGSLTPGGADTRLAETLDTLDIDYRHQFARRGRHDLVAGLGYRRHDSDIFGGAQNRADPEQRSFQRFSAFVQDEIRLIPDRWYLALGAKLEHNDFSGVELQPSVRTRWHPSRDATLWAAVSRSVRTPSRAEYDIVGERTFPGSDDGPLGLPVLAQTTADKQMDSEKLIAYELGYRWRPHRVLGLDLALFYNDYDRLRTLEPGDPQLSLAPFPRVIVPISVRNNLQGRTYGLEFTADWRPTPDWRLQGWYTLMRMDIDYTSGSADVISLEQLSAYPQQQVGLRSAWDLSHNLELDLFARYMDELPGPGFDVEAYLELDARLAWRAAPSFTLALVGRNLLNPDHQEFGQSILGNQPNRVARELFLRAELTF